MKSASTHQRYVCCISIAITAKTAAFDAGFRHAKGELIATLDGDLQYDPTDITKLLPLTKEYDLVCGRRQKRLDNIIRKISSALLF